MDEERLYLLIESFKGDQIVDSRESQYSSTTSLSTKENEFNFKDANTTATPPSTPTKLTFEEEKFSKTPQIAEDLFKR